MPDYEKRQIWAWVCTAALALTLVFSVTGDGTWMGGIGMAWMMVIPAIFILVAVYVAYRFGRMETAVAPVEKTQGKP